MSKGLKREHITLVATAARIPGNAPPMAATKIVPAVSRYNGVPKEYIINDNRTLTAIPMIAVKALYMLFFLMS